MYWTHLALLAILVHRSYAFFANDTANRLQDSLKRDCEGKSNATSTYRDELKCLAEITGDDPATRKLSDDFRKIAGEELTEITLILNTDKLNATVCKDTAKFAKALTQFRSNMMKQANATLDKFESCLSGRIASAKYGTFCPVKNETIRYGFEVAAKCSQQLTTLAKCSDLVKQVLSDPKKSADAICQSKDTFVSFAKDSVCLFADRKEVDKFVQCTKSKGVK